MASVFRSTPAEDRPVWPPCRQLAFEEGKPDPEGMVFFEEDHMNDQSC